MTPQKPVPDVAAPARLALVPIPGGRAVQLQRTSSHEGLLTMGVWGLGITLATTLPLLLRGRVPDVVVGLLAGAIIVSALVVSVVVARRAAAAATRWVVHFDDVRIALEDRRSGLVVALDRGNTALGVYRYTTKYGKGEQPTVLVSVAERDLVIGGPAGSIPTGEHRSASPPADCTAEDRATWNALRRAARLFAP